METAKTTGFILTMRNVKRGKTGRLAKVKASFILTMRNVKLLLRYCLLA